MSSHWRQCLLFDLDNGYLRNFAQIQRGDQADFDTPDGAWEKVEYPEFFWWREDYGILQEEPKTTGNRCPRCYSTHVRIGYPYIICETCGYDMELIDFPASEDYLEMVKSSF